ncbi:ABC transporter ATP-binding protein [Veronia pacifica]|uniref:ABC transporter n=1 Tax=Veronia pacifica TaxID=1080227 RepID=A0A1C3ESH5_9GAMM|nr:ABC transporter ATP-binding protein [Veronia pacifica]ODA36179.1 ABC transporter [Veronia pacifica]
MFQLSDIKVNRDGRAILSIASLDIPTDRLTVILGQNGSGKSTLAALLSGQTLPDTGQISLNQTALGSFSKREMAKQVAFLPQHLPQASGLSVKELVTLGRFPWLGTFGRMQPDDHLAVTNAMTATQINQYADHAAEHLSGGEKQRAWVSMLIAQLAPILLLDEPTSALDIHHQYHLLALLSKLSKDQKRGVIIILHDLNLALRFAQHVVALKRGTVVFDGESDELLNASRLSELYDTRIQLLNHPEENHKVAIVC